MESYSHISLSDDEITEAMIWAKRKKEEDLRIKLVREKELFNRSKSNERWSYDVISTFMINRAKDLFKGKFTLDENNEKLFELMCYYFMEDPNFVIMGTKMGFKNLSLEKGLFIPGNFGVGKTWLMQLFQKNKRQVYYMRSAKDISQAYLNSGRDKKEEMKIPDEFIEPFKNAANDAAVFFQPVSGLCIDDIGAENLKNNYGNVSNVIGDLIERRYEKKYTGVLLHGTTNMTGEQLKNYYGERVVSRMREIFNFIKLDGLDRRK